MKFPGACFTKEIRFTQNRETGTRRQSFIMWPLASRFLTREFILSRYTGSGIRCFLESFPTQKNAIINYIQAFSQHFHIVSITHSVIRGSIYFGVYSKALGEPRAIALLAASGSECLARELWGARKAGWVQLSLAGVQEPEHLLNISGAGTQELFFPIHFFARTLTLDSISLPSSSENDHYCDYEPLT